MEIKVLGTGCANCKALYATVEQAVKDLNLDATLLKEEDILKIMGTKTMTDHEGQESMAGTRRPIIEVKNLRKEYPA